MDAMVDDLPKQKSDAEGTTPIEPQVPPISSGSRSSTPEHNRLDLYIKLVELLHLKLKLNVSSN